MNDERAIDVWVQVLGSYELALDQHEAALDAAAESVELQQIQTFEPPGSLPPIPGELQERAFALAARTSDLVARAAEFTSESRPSRDATRHRRDRRQVASSTFDQRG